MIKATMKLKSISDRMTFNLNQVCQGGRRFVWCCIVELRRSDGLFGLITLYRKLKRLVLRVRRRTDKIWRTTLWLELDGEGLMTDPRQSSLNMDRDYG